MKNKALGDSLIAPSIPAGRRAVYPDGEPSWSDLVLLAALYFGAAKLGLLTVMPEGIAVFWAPNSVVLAMLIRFQGARLAAIGAVVVAAEIVADVPTFSVAEAVLFGLINFGEAVLAFALLRRVRFDRSFSSLDDVRKFVLCAPVLAALAAALAGAAVYSGFRGGQTTYVEFVRIWWFGDALGLMVLTPLWLGFRPFRHGAAPDARLVLEPRDVAVGIAAALSFLAFWFAEELRGRVGPILILPFVLYVAARFPLRWTAAAVAAVALLLVIAMAQGRQPFGALPGREAVIHAQEFILILSVLGLGTAALLVQLRTRQAELIALNAALEERVEARTAELARVAATDALSGIPNRRSFDEALAREAARVERYGGSLSLVLADIDHFKRINDSYGHAKGDEVIREVAQRLRACARDSDVVARYGGEEFAILLPKTSVQQALCFAERARAAVSGKPMAGLPECVSASFGIAELGEAGSAKQLIRDADAVLYRAKVEGRNRVVATAKSS